MLKSKIKGELELQLRNLASLLLFLEEFWNGAPLEDEGREDLGIRGCRRLQQE
jgi:hypothetical protein